MPARGYASVAVRPPCLKRAAAICGCASTIGIKTVSMIKKRRKRKAEQADSATKPYTRMLERAYTGNVAARYMHRCPNCNIVVHNEFYHCPWCGARQPEVWETEE